jgi:hypothetical protein
VALAATLCAGVAAWNDANKVAAACYAVAALGWGVSALLGARAARYRPPG